jgi:decaprenylphospho-beta-D-ribofuranose 2-oxidase
MPANLPFFKETLFSFDGSYQASSTIVRPERLSELHQIGLTSTPLIARGAGVSYVPASFLEGGTTIDMRMFDRILSFDPAAGIVEVEAGIRLAELHKFLTSRGWYMPVQPGHGGISVGGCIAVDVHGKNQAKDGNFSASILSVKLFHPDHGILDLSPSNEPTLFDATCGGYGLTGIIVSARLQARRLRGSKMVIEILRVASATEAAAEMRVRVDTSDVIYSWHDFTGSRHRGVIVSGCFALGSESAESRQSNELSAAWRRRWPIALLNGVTCPVLNEHYYVTRGRPRTSGGIDLRRAIFPIEGLETYFRLFGRAGFREYQAIVPQSDFASYVEEVRTLARHRHMPIALAAGKIFEGKTRFLRFTGCGFCLAINVPAREGTDAFLADLDRVLVQVRGRPNLIKDSRLPAAVVEATYPELGAFKVVLADFDRRRLFRSALSKRIGL